MKRRQGSVPIDSIFHSVSRSAGPAGSSGAHARQRSGSAGTPGSAAAAGMGHAHGAGAGGRPADESDEEDVEVTWADAVVGDARLAPATSRSAPKNLGGGAAAGGDEDGVGLVELSVLKENSPGAGASQAEPPTFLSSWLHDSAGGAVTTLGGKRMRSAPKSLGGRLAELAPAPGGVDADSGNKVRRMDVDGSTDGADAETGRSRPRSALGQAAAAAGMRPRALGRRTASAPSPNLISILKASAAPAAGHVTALDAMDVDREVAQAMAPLAAAEAAEKAQPATPKRRPAADAAVKQEDADDDADAPAPGSAPVTPGPVASQDSAVSSQSSVFTGPRPSAMANVVRGSTAFTMATFQRLVVLHSAKQPFEDAHGGKGVQLQLHLFDERAASERFVALRGSWMDTAIQPGDCVNVIGQFTGSPPTCVLDDADGSDAFLVAHPDILVSSTRVTDSLSCGRRAVLAERFRMGEKSLAMINGDMIHGLFQHALQAGDFTSMALAQSAERIVKDAKDGLYAVGVSEDDVRQTLREVAPVLQQWAHDFLGGLTCTWPHDAGASGAGARINFHSRTTTSAAAVRRVLDIEENIWSPAFGLKGKIDATVEAVVRDDGPGADGTVRSYLLPLELKTGKHNDYHFGQILLYSLMLTDRYGIAVRNGLLFNTKTSQTTGAPVATGQLRSLVQARNELAINMAHSGRRLPPVIGRQFACRFCSLKERCALLHRAVENGTAESFGVPAVFKQATEHLTETHVNYFATWDKIMTAEGEVDGFNARKVIWLTPGETRDEAGKAFGSLVLRGEASAPSEAAGSASSGGATPHIYRFKKMRFDGDKGRSLREYLLQPGDGCVISTEQGHFAVAMGVIVSVGRHDLTVRTLDELKVPFAPGTGGLKTEPDTAVTTVPEHRPGREDVLFRIDRDELSFTFAAGRENVARLFVGPSPDEKRRRLVVDLDVPLFDDARAAGLMGEHADKLAGMNSGQRAAVAKVLAAEDYALILGMPGTGKTTTLTSLIRILVSAGKSVLLTSYTHSAVDTVLLKLKETGVDFVRLGRKPQVHAQLQESVLSPSDFDSVDAYAKRVETVPVVAVSCLGIGHAALTHRHFDYCIVDEASQISQAVCLGPLRLADKFVLVGDLYQLPPLVRNAEAKELGLAISLFRRLGEHHPDAIVQLDQQYRMNADIMLLSNVLIYCHRLRCGSAAIAEAALRLPRESRRLDEAPWLRDVCRADRRVVFVDTDRVPATDERVGDAVTNPVEADLVAQLATALIECGLDVDELGIISPYRSQLRLLRDAMRNFPAAEINTVDKFQGRDKECILISLVRSNDQLLTGDLLRDWQRINVALTRAKRKLVLFGSRSTLSTLPLFEKLLDLLQSRNWIYTLQPGANRMTVIEYTTPRRASSRRLFKNAAGVESASTLVAQPQRVAGSGRRLDLDMEDMVYM